MIFIYFIVVFLLVIYVIKDLTKESYKNKSVPRNPRLFMGEESHQEADDEEEQDDLIERKRLNRVS